MSKQIHVGKVAVGGGAPVSIQSMCNTHTEDTPATVAQILRLEQAGCEIVRVAVPDMAAAQKTGAVSYTHLQKSRWSASAGMIASAMKHSSRKISRLLP